METIVSTNNLFFDTSRGLTADSTTAPTLQQVASQLTTPTQTT